VFAFDVYPSVVIKQKKNQPADKCPESDIDFYFGFKHFIRKPPFSTIPMS